MERVRIGGSYSVAKASEPDQNVFGWFSVAALADGEPIVDADGDTVPIEEIEKASWQFVKGARLSGEEHDGRPAEAMDGALITSVVFTDDILDALSVNPADGTVNEVFRKALHEHMPRGWFGGFHIDSKAAWERARDEKAEFSIEGHAYATEDA